MIPPSGTCVWGCESGQPFNREHIIGRQFAKALGVRLPIEMRWGDIQRGTQRSIRTGVRTENELAVYLDNRVCARCNGKWMKRLDDRTTNLLRPALEHEQPVALNPKKQLLVARWATKVGLLLALWLHDQPLTDPEIRQIGHSYAPADNFTSLYANQHGLPDRTRVWIGALHLSVPAAECFVAANQIESNIGPTGYYAVFCLKRLVFFVTGLELAYSGETIDGWPDPREVIRDPRALAPIWPRSETTLTWPQAPRLVVGDLAAVVELKPNLGLVPPPREPPGP